MNVVNSSGRLEYFADGPNADFFAPAIGELRGLVVPTINILEVFKRILQQRSESKALEAAALMHQGLVADLNSSLAWSAARLSVDLKLPLADSVILATARACHAQVLTQVADFKGIKQVKYTPSK
jgi:PIN domain nuclease of toxin-antitoxin system